MQYQDEEQNQDGEQRDFIVPQEEPQGGRLFPKPNKTWEPKPVRYKVPQIDDYSFECKDWTYSNEKNVVEFDPESEAGKSYKITVYRTDYEPASIPIHVVPTEDEPTLVRKQELDRIEWKKCQALLDLERLEAAVKNNDWTTATDNNLQLSARNVKSEKAKNHYKEIAEQFEAYKALADAIDDVTNSGSILTVLQKYKTARNSGRDFNSENKDYFIKAVEKHLNGVVEKYAQEYKKRKAEEDIGKFTTRQTKVLLDELKDIYECLILLSPELGEQFRTECHQYGIPIKLDKQK